MNVLIITPSIHGKNVGAVQKDIYGTIELLQKMGHTVAMYSIITHHRDDSMAKQVAAKYGIDLRLFNAPLHLTTRIKDMLMTRNFTYFDGSVHVFHEMIHDPDFNSFVSTFAPDRIISFNSYSWPAIAWAKQKNIPCVFRSHNFESSFYWESLRALEKYNPINWLRYVAKYYSEKLAVMNASATATLPFEQVSTYKTWVDPSRIYILTLTFLPASLREPQLHPEKKVLDIFYLGANYSVIYHRRGAEMLIKEIAPRVLKEAPHDFIFHICGAKLPEHLVKLCQGAIVHEGYVPDLEAFLATMDIGVFPVETGKTMKGKTFESIARAFPVVMSPNCLGGYDLQSGKHIALASTVDEFVQTILSLRDVQKRKTLAEGARAFSLQHFSDAAVEGMLATVIAKRY